jgi:hypothetical protein
MAEAYVTEDIALVEGLTMNTNLSHPFAMSGSKSEPQDLYLALQWIPDLRFGILRSIYAMLGAF